MTKSSNSTNNKIINSTPSSSSISSLQVLPQKISMKSSELEARVLRLLVNKGNRHESTVSFFDAPDSHLLKCTQMKSILANKNDGFDDTNRSDDSCNSTDSSQEDAEASNNTTIFGFSWLQTASSCDTTSEGEDTLLHIQFDTGFIEESTTIYHLSQQQHTHIINFLEKDFIPQTNEEIYTMLQSVLLKYPSSTTWSTQQQQQQQQQQITVCLLLPGQLLQQEQLFNFRVGDVAPSFYLHCMVPLALPSTTTSSSLVTMIQNYILESSSNTNITQQQQFKKPKDVVLASMMVYRQLPQRFHLQPNLKLFSNLFQQHDLLLTASDTAVTANGDQNNIQVTYHPSTTPSAICGNHTSNSFPVDSWNIAAPPMMLWEMYHRNDESSVEDQPSINTNNDELSRLSFRLVAPPYIDNWRFYYGSILDHFLEPNNFQALQEEAKTIPQWIPWPEQQHYSTSSEQDNNKSIGGGNTWTVFPLLHTFPAYQAENRKWIESTMSHCPRTCHMLQRNNCLNNQLRTALFSRLGPNMTLAPHTGWKDLANHVLRIHIPLIVPNCCGTWVDGCVRTHQEGVIQVFDDSKVHRAFNYNSTCERIVLIIDLARPPTLPLGTAIGGHTEELDDFIEQMT